MNDVTKPVLTAGRIYPHPTRGNWQCLFTRGNFAWLCIAETDNTAYVWTLSGESVSLGPDYDLNPAEYI